MDFSTPVYLSCAVIAGICSALLWRRRAQAPLLFWSALCFAGLTVNNILLLLDKYLTPYEETLHTWRLLAGLLALLVLIWGLVFSER